MYRNRSRSAAFLAAAIFGVQLFLVAPVAATDSLPLPSSMAAVGDSITQAASSAGSLGTDAPQNSWSTGTSTTVNSHYLRLIAAAAQISDNNFNRSVSGAKMLNLDAQMQGVVSLRPDYLTVLMGGNDLCTDTVAQMTDVASFRTQFAAAMQRITQSSPTTHVYVVSVPNAYQLWELFHGSFWARLVWASAGICQSLLANPTSTQQADVQRRQQVYDRNVAYNGVLRDVCLTFVACRFDGNAVFNTAFIKSDVSGDYFHPSVAGQAKLASVSWTAGYTFASAPPPNQPPTASFITACSDLACTFANTSNDPEGLTLTSAWSFGDGATATTQDAAHTYSNPGTYTVGLTVTDVAGATSSASQSVTVTAPVASITLTASGSVVRGKTRVDLAWSGAAGASMDVFRNGARITTTPNDGAYTDTSRLKAGTYTYKVCQAGTVTCSNEATVNL